jgi:predicted ATPase/class 3 adenylate cyclase
MADLPSGLVTFCFTDIEGSTQLFARHGTDFLELLEEHRRIIRTAVAQHGGAEVKTEGDGFFLAYPSAANAVASVAKFQRAMREHGWPPDGMVKVRVGLHLGHASPIENDYMVFAVHEAARIGAAANGGQTVVSDAFAIAVGNDLPPGIALRDLGVHQLKDLGPMRLHQLSDEQSTGDFPPLRTVGGPRGYVPATASSLVGRDQDIADLRGQLRKARMVTVIGSGGVGKTRLAIEVARGELGARTDGVWFIDLAAITDPGRVDDAVLQALGVVRDSGVGARDQLIGYLTTRDALLVVDNCEHVVDTCSALIAAVLRGCPTVDVLATSREPLGVDGEIPWRTRSLDEHESERLFVDRALPVRPDLDLDEASLSTIRQITERLDGIPLAIELAAARTRILSVAQISERLDDRFRLLTGGSRTALARQRTLEATVDWSYELLDGDEQRLLRSASVFVGGFDLEAVDAIWGGDAIDVLDRLVEKSMITTRLAGDRVRYRLLETIRHYGWNKLLDSGDVERVRDAHMHHFASLVGETSEGLMDAREAEAAERITMDHDNIVAAIDWAMARSPRTALEFAAHMWMYWSVVGRTGEGWQRIQQILAIAPDDDQELWTRAHTGAGHMCWIVEGTREQLSHHTALATADIHDPPRWWEAWSTMQSASAAEVFNVDLPIIETAVDMARSAGNDFVLAHVLSIFGSALENQGRLAEGLVVHEEALETALRSGSIATVGELLTGLAWLHLARADVDQALATAERAVAAAYRGPNVYFQIFALLVLGRCRSIQGDLADAAIAFERSLAIADEHGIDRDTARAQIELGWVDVEAGRLDQAVERFHVARDRMIRVASLRQEFFLIAAMAGHNMTEVAQLRGDLDEARASFQANLAMVDGTDAPAWVPAYVCNSLGWLEQDAGDLDAAERWHKRALDTASDLQHWQQRQSYAASMRGLAGVALRRSDVEGSARLSGAASSIVEPNNTVPRLGTLRHREVVVDAREALGTEAFEAAWEEGRAIGLEGATGLLVP